MKAYTKKRAHARAKPKAHARPAPSTALARRRVIPIAPPAELARLTDDVTIGALGLHELDATEKEEAVLALPVDPRDVEIKPNGRPYLSHPFYTRRLNQAFGRGAWQLVPVSKPMQAAPVGSRITIGCWYVLFVHGRPVASALGEHEYDQTNDDQSYGDALESTIASALRRCVKHLGIGLELWDRRWLATFVAQHCLKVWCDVHGKRKALYRRKDSAPFWNEVGGRPGKDPVDTGSERPAGGQTPAPDPVPSQPDAPITDEQVKRLWAIANKVKRAPTEVKAWLVIRYGVDSSKAIKRKDYDEIVRRIEAPGRLPLPEGSQEHG